MELLLPTQYRKESTGYPKNVNKKVWFEIYKNTKTNKWKIEKADLKISYGFDECVGEEVMIIQSKHDNAVLFFTPSEGLSQNPTTILEDKPLSFGKATSFKLNEINYTLSLSGKMRNIEGKNSSTGQNPNESEDKNSISEIKKFNLFFSSEKAKQYTIAEMSELSDDSPRIIWAGDLNDDGLPDMILDLSEDYESLHLFFFLSDKNDKKKPLKKIGDAREVFDC